MNESNQYQDKLDKIIPRLPEVCIPFLTETGTEMSLSTRYSYATELQWFFKYLIDEKEAFEKIENVKDLTLGDIRKITAQDISKYLSRDKDRGKAEHTIMRRRSAISRFFSFLLVRQEVGYNPAQAASKVKIHKTEEVVYIDILEQKRLLSSVESGYFLTKREQKYHDKYQCRDLALISLFLDTGIRISELYRIDIKDINFENCSIYILRKGGNKQYVYFSDGVKELILDYIEEKKANGIYFSDKDPLFTTLKGGRLSTRAIQNLVQKYAKSSLSEKGAKITPHKLRSSFAMEYYDSTKDILALQKKLGHNNITTTNIYAKATNVKMKETRNILDEKRSDGAREEEWNQLVRATKTLVSAGVLSKKEALERLSITEKEYDEIS